MDESHVLFLVLGTVLWNIVYDGMLWHLREQGYWFSYFANDTIIIVEDRHPVGLKQKIKVVIKQAHKSIFAAHLIESGHSFRK